MKITWQFLDDELIECCREIAKKYHEGRKLFTEDSYSENFHALLGNSLRGFLKKVSVKLNIEIEEDIMTRSLDRELRRLCSKIAEGYHKGWKYFSKDGYDYNLLAVLSNFLTDFLSKKLGIGIDITFPPK